MSSTWNTITAVVPPADLGDVDPKSIREVEREGRSTQRHPSAVLQGFTAGSGDGAANPRNSRAGSVSGMEWSVAHHSLQSLRCLKTSPLFVRLAFVVSLDVSNNKLQSLKGVAAFSSLETLDASYNLIRVGDANTLMDLTQLTNLCSVDLSHNLIHRMELEEFGLNASSRSRLQTEARHLTLIDLSFNRLVKLPDVRLAPTLEILHLDHNIIEDLSDIENKIPLSHLHTLHLAGNRITHVHQVVPVAALAHTLNHLTVSGNPFAMRSPELLTRIASPKSKESRCRWWRPVLLWLLPLLQSIDQVELTACECAVAEQLFRERSVGLSRDLLELLNAPHKAKLERHVLQFCSEDLLSPETEKLLQEEEETCYTSNANHHPNNASSKSIDPDDGGEGDAETLQADDPSAAPTPSPNSPPLSPEEMEPPVPPLLLSGQTSDPEDAEPTSFINTKWGGGPTSAHHAARTNSETVERTDLLDEEPRMYVGRGASSSSRLVAEPTVEGSVSPSVVTPQRGSEGPLRRSMGLLQSSLQSSSTLQNNSFNIPMGGGVPQLTAVVKAIQSKLKTLSGVVETLYKADMVRRTYAAIVIQKYFRGTLTRMHLSEDESESCRFIRSQLKRFFSPQHVAVLAEAAYRRSQNTTPNRGFVSARDPRPSHHEGAPLPTSSGSLGDRDMGADLREVLQNMRSLQKVITTMWKDLEAYRQMAARERRRAAITIQRHFRGSMARREYRELQEGYRAFVDSLSPLVFLLQRAGRGMQGRRRMALEVAPKHRLRRLEDEVLSLKSKMSRMENMMQRLLDAGNPAREGSL